MIKIKYESDYQCHISGYRLYFNGKRINTGYFEEISDLRYYWFLWRIYIVNGYKEDGFNNWIKA